ncbi:MBL fold metallo-hydrolase [Halosegnis marinus]|uniref:MBL fold metallo-hydrolase n=1 Tax=Halosegnis marinus TaxID=3034023 RepID=A0ABD5ZR92_9EURY|nr:MBL fold metallo-hydrolase [Halosegnis sp. DT85]
MTVTRIPVPHDRVPHGAVNAYVVERGGRAVLVDPPERHPDIDAAVPADLDAVAVTHHHPDHAGGVAHYARETGATVWGRAGRERAFEAATGVAPDRTFREGTDIADTLAVLDTPGHAPEHVGFSTPEGLLGGDLAVAEGSVAVAAPEGDLRAYLTSLRRVRTRSPDRIYPGHGPVIEDPRATCERLVRHRLDRERRVLAAIREGADTLDAVTEAAYEKDVSAVWEMAVATVAAHVEKLAVEGRVRRDGDRVRPT